MPPSAHEIHQLKKAPPVEGVLPPILDRWSPRSFTDREVTAAELKTLFEAVRWAPSSFNEQPWRFLVGGRNSNTYNKILASLMPFNQKWAQKAPVLILGAAKKKFSHNDGDNAFALFDLGAASGYLVLQASVQGLATHQMAGYDQAAVRQSLVIPESYELGSVIALGYQGEPAALPNEQMLTQEVSTRQRKALSDFVFRSWDMAANLG
jgi:nitroreductase